MTWLLLALLAHDPITTKITWSVEISRIVNRRCISCHGSGSSVDLSSYALGRPWAKAIRNQVLQRKMPPWGAVKGFGQFSNDPSLTALEMEMIDLWVEGGAPEGDPAYLPRAITQVETKRAAAHWFRPPATVAKALTILAIRPSGPTEVSAYLPDGTVQHLIWIRNPQVNYKQAYFFRDPITLPAGTKVIVTGATVEVE